MAGFVDECQLNVRGGDGGAGCVSFRREAPRRLRAAPTAATAATAATSGCVADRNVASLLAFRDHPHRRAADGAHGKGKDKHGARGDDIVVNVPEGTVVQRPATPARCSPTWSTTATAGSPPPAAGAGGATPGSSPTAAGRPSFAEQGEQGEERWLRLELKLMADVALVGFPNAGKSTLISRDLGGQAEDRRLPVHHARAPPRRRAARRRHRVRRRRHPRPDRGRERGPRPRPPVPAPHRAGPGAVRAARPRRGRRHHAGGAGGDAAATSSARTSPSCSNGPASWSGPRPTSLDEPLGRAAHLGRHRRRHRPTVGRLGELVAEARDAEPDAERLRRSTVPSRRASRSSASATASSASTAAPRSAPSPCPTSPTPTRSPTPTTA